MPRFHFFTAKQGTCPLTKFRKISNGMQLQRVWLASRERLLLRTHWPVPFWNCICFICWDQWYPLSIKHYTNWWFCGIPACDAYCSETNTRKCFQFHTRRTQYESSYWPNAVSLIQCSEFDVCRLFYDQKINAPVWCRGRKLIRYKYR